MSDLQFFREIFANTQIHISFRNQIVDSLSFNWTQKPIQENLIAYEGQWNGITLRVMVERADENLVKMNAQMWSKQPFHCDKIIFHYLYHKPQADFSEYYVPGGNLTCGIAGLKKLKDTPHTPEDVRFCGLFHKATEPCLLLGTQIPCNMILKYQAALEQKDRVLFTATNYFTSSRSDQYSLTTETVCVITGLPPVKAVCRYGELVPKLPKAELAEPLIGWSTWDYY